MSNITVGSHDLRAALSLLRVYMGREKPAGHFKDSGKKLVDASYWVKISNLETALREQDPQGSRRLKES